jgi:hypothetical protein
VQAFNKRLLNSPHDGGFGVRRSPDGTLDFSKSTLLGDEAAMDVVNFIDNKLQSWGDEVADLTPEGLDTLKRMFDNKYTETNLSQSIVADVRGNLRELLASEVDGYAKLTKGYEEATNFINEINRTLSTKDGTPDTVMRKLNQAVKDNFELRGQLLDQIDHEIGTSLVDMIAGNQMSSWMAQNMVGRFAGLAAAGFVVDGGISAKVLAGLFASSPKVVANTMKALGVPKAAAKKFIKNRPKLKSQFDAIIKATNKGGLMATPGLRAAVPAVRLEQATGEYDNLINQGVQ